MEEATPREIIRGVLTTSSVSKSARTLRPRRTPRVTNARETPVNPPSHAEVASRLLTRSRSGNKRKATSASATAATPTDSTTPRTLISGFLQTAPVAKSVVKGKKKKTVQSDENERSLTTATSGAEDNTPRTTIQNLLREAIAETPEEPIHSQSSDAEDDDITQQSNEGETQSQLMSSGISDQEKTDEQSVPMAAARQTDDVAMVVTTPRLLDSYEEGEDTVQNESGHGIQELDSLSSISSDQALQTDTTVIRGSIRGNAAQMSGQWRDLVTPELPLHMSPAASRVTRSRASMAPRPAGERTFFGGKPPVGKATGKSSKKASGPKMPSALVKNIFQHFSKAKVSKEALQAVENGSNLFFKRLSSDLMAYCQHAHRTTIELADVELLMKRQGFVTENESLYSLVEKYLPLEYRQEIIPTVQAGNKIVLK